MARPKKVVSEKMQKLLASQADLKENMGYNKQAYKEYIKDAKKLFAVEEKIAALKDKEAAKKAK